MVRLKDIAEEAGVSVSTVSRILSGNNPHVARADLREKVLEIAEREKYRSSGGLQFAKRSDEYPLNHHVIGFVFARTNTNDPFFSQLSQNTADHLAKHRCIMEYNLSLQEVSSDFIINTFTEHHVDGAVVFGRCKSEFLARLCANVNNNVIYTGLNKRDIQCDQVLCDAFVAGELAVQQLYQVGHRKIGYIGEINDEVRYTAYEHFMEHTQGISFDSSRVVDAPLTAEGGYSGLKRLLAKAPDTTGIFCANDTTAIGALRACRDLGINIPKDISIIGMDDVEIAQFLSPRLSTIHIPINEMGLMTAKLLLDRIRHEHTTPFTLTFRSQAIMRESCGAPRII